MLRDDARGLRTALDAKDLENLADALIHGVRRNPELCRNLLRREMLIDKLQTVELSARQSCYALGHFITLRGVF
jgi:hypothetical protein